MDARSLYNKLPKVGDNICTEFWLNVCPAKAEGISSISKNNRRDQIANKIQNEVSHALKLYSEFMLRTQYFKPNIDNANKFLNNADFISRQINFFNESTKCIDSFLGTEEKEFMTLLRY